MSGEGTLTGGEMPTTPPRRALRLRPLALRVVPAAVLCGLIAWSLSRLGARPTKPPPPPVELAAASPPPEPSAPEAAAPPPPPEPAPEDEGLGTLQGTPVPVFLAVKVEQLRDQRTAVLPIGGGPISERTISLVNLWAPWCSPCKKELPLLRGFFAAGRRERGWPASVQFVALMVDDNTTARAARRRFGGDMPDETVFLVDRGIDGGVKEALAATDMYGSSLPVTLLFDCNRRVRWHRIGELSAADLAELAPQIDALRAEKSCRKPAPRGEGEAPKLLPVKAAPGGVQDDPEYFEDEPPGMLAGQILDEVEAEVPSAEVPSAEDEANAAEESAPASRRSRRPSCQRDEDCGRGEKCLGRKDPRCTKVKIQLSREDR